MVSVIITLYNKEYSIKRTILSVLEQTYKDIEIIVVNDYSTDNSLNICNEFLPNIRVITTDQNYGLPNARQIGIKHAKGNFITFIDADDYLSNDAINKCIETQKQSDADIVQMNIIRRITRWNIPIKFPSMYDAPQALNACLYKELLFPVQCCGKFYKVELLKSATQLKYDGFWGEDRIFNIPILSSNPTIAVADNAKYNYIWGGKTSSTHDINALQEYKQVFQIKTDWAIANGYEQHIPSMQNELTELLKYHIRQLINSGSLSQNEAIQYLQNELKQPFWPLFKLPQAHYLYSTESKSICRLIKKKISNLIK